MVPLLVSVCFLPLVVWLAVLFRDQSLGRGVIVAGFFAGFLAVLAAVVPISALTRVLSPTLADFAGAFIEELAKLVAVAFVARGLRGKSGSRGLLAVAVLVGLSFASFENVAYALRNPLYLPFRLVSAAPLHAALSLCATMSLAGRRTRERSAARFTSGWFFAAFAMHSFFNLALDAGSSLLVAAGGICVGAVWFAVILWRRSGEDAEDA
jgi:RsiW-degrading membrane proteinase PrsW (M82 family)